MENIDIGTSSTEFIAVRQTLEELCEKVCPRESLPLRESLPTGLVGINHENLNVPKVMCGAAETMALLTPNGENGSSVGVLSNSIHGAVKGSIECDIPVASTGKLVVVPKSVRRLSEEPPSSNSTGSLSEHGMKCDTSVIDTIKPMEVPMSGGNAAVEMLGNFADGASKQGMEFDGNSGSTSANSLKPMLGDKGCSEEPLNNSAGGTNKHGIEYGSTLNTTNALKAAVVLTPGGKGCSEEPLSNSAVDDAGKHGMESAGTSHTSNALKPMVIPPHGGNGSPSEPSGYAMNNARECGMECDDTSETSVLKPMVTLTVSKNDCSDVPVSADPVIKGGGVKGCMQCDVVIDTDTVMDDNDRETCSVGKGADYHHENDNNLCAINKEATEEPHCDVNKGTQEDQRKILQPMYYEGDSDESESEGKLNVSEEGIPVASENIASELTVCEHGSEHKSSSPPSCSTNAQSNVIEFPKQTANTCNQVAHVQNNENVRDTRVSRQKRKKKVVSKNNKSNVQTPRSASYTHGRNVEVNEFEFVLKVVQQDLEEIQMSSQATTLAASLREGKDKNRTEDESESSDTSSSSSSSDSTSSESDSESIVEILIDDDVGSVRVPNDLPKTRDEVLFSELPPPPDVEVLANKSQIKPIGEIESIIYADAMVIIKSFPGMPALDSDSILFLDDGRGFGQVFEIFGQVTSPHYCVRFNSQAEIRGKNLSIGQTVFYAPDTESMTNFVFVSKLQSIKGSDASWKHDQEPPQEMKEYSDDEAESAAKAAKKKANKLKNRNQTSQTQQKDTYENAKNTRPPNQTTNCHQPPWKRQTTQVHQPRHSYQPPPRPFNVRGHPAEFYGERFPPRQNSPVLFNARPPPPGLGPPSMQRLPTGTFYNHPQGYQGYDALVPHLQQPQAPPYFRGPHHHLPPDMHAMFLPANVQQRHIPPPPNVGQPLDQLWTPRVNYVHPNGQSVDLGQFPRPRWSTVQPPLPPDHCSPR